MRLILVDNLIVFEDRGRQFFDLHPHLGLASLASVARSGGHECDIFDPKREIRNGRLIHDESLYSASADLILQSAPEAVGFTALGATFLYALGVARALRAKSPDLPILLGGPHATMLDRTILERWNCFDVVVRNEAEQTLLPVLAALECRNFRDIPGLSFRTLRGAWISSTPGLPRIDDLDSLPLPAYDCYPIDELDLGLLRIEAGRGCPYECTFCATARFFQRRFRLKSPARLVEELDRLHERYRIGTFTLDHDLFTVNRHKVVAFCEAVRGRGYRWKASARVDRVDTALLEQMAEAGCVSLYFGIETGSPRLQRTMKKRLDLDLVDPVLDVCQALGITTTASFITGYPDEERADQDQTLDRIGRCFARATPTCHTQLHLLAPEPGTPLFAEHASELRYDGRITEFNARPLTAVDEQTIRDHSEVFATYHYYPSVLARADHGFALELVELFHRLGDEIAASVLECFGDIPLSELAARLRPTGATPEALIDLAMEEFGPQSLLVSLLRFGFEVSLRRELDFEPEPAQRPSGTSCYELAPRAIFFEGSCDCVAFLERRRSHAIRGSDWNPRFGPYLVIVNPCDVIGMTLDESTARLLECLRQPRNYRELADDLGFDGGLRDRLAFQLIALTQRGALVPAAARAH
jgi:radical SAM superfamily enzyme YgiQ (UPF0313 family)